MSDLPGNGSDRPEPSGEPQQPQQPAWTPAAAPQPLQQPAWMPPVAPQAPVAPVAPMPPQQPAWTPQPTWQPQAPTTDPNQGWQPQAPMTDPNQGWQPQQQAPAQPIYGNLYGQPAQQAPKSGGKLWQIVSIVLVVLLLVVGGGLGYAYMNTSSDLNKTKDSLAAEQAAHKKDNAAYGACVASMKTDDSALSAAMSALTVVTDSTATGGDIDAARELYETDLLAAEDDFHTSAYYFYSATNQTDWNLGVDPYNKALAEFKAAEADLTALNGLISDYTDAVSAAEAQVTAAQAQMAKTATQCAAASSGAASSK